MKEGFSWGLNEMFDNIVNWLFLIFSIKIRQLSQQVKKKTNHCQQESLAQV